MRSRFRSISVAYTNSQRLRRAGLLSALLALSAFAGLVACGDSDDAGGSLVNASSSGYVPATPATMPQLPPGAGPRDAGVNPMPDTGTITDSATPDVAVPDSAPTDAPPG